MSRPSGRAPSRPMGLPSRPIPRSRSNSALRSETTQMPPLTRHRSIASEQIRPSAPPVPSPAVPKSMLRRVPSSNNFPNRPLATRGRSVERPLIPGSQAQPPPVSRGGLAAAATPPSSFTYAGLEVSTSVPPKASTSPSRPTVSPRSSSGSSSGLSMFSQERGYASSATSIADASPNADKGEIYDMYGQTWDSAPTREMVTSPTSSTSLRVRLAAARTALTTDVTKALSTAGDETQAAESEEGSRLSKVLQAYHTKKAQTSSEALVVPSEGGAENGIFAEDASKFAGRPTISTPIPQHNELPTIPNLSPLPNISRPGSRNASRPGDAASGLSRLPTISRPASRNNNRTANSAPGLPRSPSISRPSSRNDARATDQTPVLSRMPTMSRSLSHTDALAGTAPGLSRFPSRPSVRNDTRLGEAGPSAPIPRRPTNDGKDSMSRLQGLRLAKRNAKVRFSEAADDDSAIFPPPPPLPRLASPPAPPSAFHSRSGTPAGRASPAPIPVIHADPAPWFCDAPRKAPSPPDTPVVQAPTPRRKGVMRMGLPKAVRLRLS